MPHAAIALALLAAAVPGSDGAIPFPAALDAAAIRLDRLDDIHERSLILGNGSLSGLLLERDGALLLRITKDDVWDARIDTSEDPPITAIDIAGLRRGPSDGSWSS
jgi:hypothetical protein